MVSNGSSANSANTGDDGWARAPSDAHLYGLRAVIRLWPFAVHYAIKATGHLQTHGVYPYACVPQN
jgi:hypothetical protein